MCAATGSLWAIPWWGLKRPTPFKDWTKTKSGVNPLLAKTLNSPYCSTLPPSMQAMLNVTNEIFMQDDCPMT